MYTAKVEGQSIDVDNISISFRLKNPMFDANNGMEWSATYPFKLPNTETNRAIFGYPARTSLKDKHVKDYEFEHYFNGIRLPGDTIRVTLAGTGEIEAYVKIGRSDFISINKNKKLKDLQFESVYYNAWDPDDPDYPYFWKGASDAYPDIPFALFTVRNDGFFKNTVQSNWWLDNTANTYGPYQNLIYYDPAFKFNPDCITPFPYLNAVIDQIFLDSNYELTGNPFADDAELNRLCIFNPNKAIYYVDGLSGHDYASFSLADHLPGISIPDFFINLRVPFGADLYFNNHSRKVKIVLRGDIINSSDIVDISQNTNPGIKVTVNDPITKFKFSMINDDADSHWSATTPGLSDYAGDEITAYPTYADLPAGASTGDLGYVMSNDTIYVFDYDEESEVNTWLELTLNLLDYEVGEDPEITIEGNIGAVSQVLDEYSGDVSPTWQWGIPKVDQPGNNSRRPLSSKTGYADFTLRLMFFRGTNQDVDETISYVLGSSFNYDYFPHLAGDPAYSLRWDGDEQQGLYKPTGLYTKFWKDWLTWRKTTRMVEFSRVFSAYELYSLDFSKKHFALNKVLILDEINFTVTNTQIKPANVKAWTV